MHSLQKLLYCSLCSILFLSLFVHSENDESIYKITCLDNIETSSYKCIDANGIDIDIELIDSDPSKLGNAWSISVQSGESSITITGSKEIQTAILSKTVEGVISVYEGNYDLFDSGSWVGKITINRNGGTYLGTVDENDRMSGFGSFTYQDGSFFDGEYLNGFPIKGKYIKASGDVYEGEFQAGSSKYSGYGQYSFSSGHIYKGNFSGGLYNGFGEMIYPNGDSYSGTWKDGNRHGLGTYTWKKSLPLQDKYFIGTYESGAINGVGVYLREDYTPSYIGDILDGEKTGKGAQNLRNNDEGPIMFWGAFQKGISQGMTEMMTDNYFYQGHWSKGANGYGTTRNLKADASWTGTHINGSVQGQGTYKTDEYTYEGGLKNGLFHGDGKVLYTGQKEPIFVKYTDGTYTGELQLEELKSLGDKRIALVIGNDEYQSRPLANAVNDAIGMKTTLERLGFEVIFRENVTQSSFISALFEFGKRISSLGPNTTSLFYYAGHAVQVDGANYLNPVDTKIRNKSDLEINSINARRILSEMASNQSGTKIIILDACRSNPFNSFVRSSVSGLAQMTASTGTIISYATAPGQEALDSNVNGNSFYTGSLMRAMNTPGLTIEQVFKQTRQDVVSLSNGIQVPWESSSLLGDFYFLKD